jgi:hypothetical protein
LYHSKKEENFVHFRSGEEKNKIHASGFNYSDDKQITLDSIKTIDNITIIDIDVEKEYDMSFDTSPIHKADIIRIMKLYEHGGIWLDLDILFIKPTPPSLLTNFYIQYFTYSNTVPTGLLVSTPKNNCIEYIYNSCKEKISSQNINNDWQQFGPNLWRDCIFNNSSLYENCNILDNKMVYPYMWDEPQILFFSNDDRIMPNTFCIHWYNGNIHSRQFIQNFNPNNIDKNRCIFEKQLYELFNL